MSSSPTVHPPGSLSNYAFSLDASLSSVVPEEEEASIFLNPGEDIQAFSREELEENYLDLKDEIWRLRRKLGLDSASGAKWSGGGYVSSRGLQKDQRVAVFVDVQNMYYSARQAIGRNLSYGMLLRACVGTRELVRAMAYLIHREGKDQSSFLKMLHHTGFEARLRAKIERADGRSKAEWEVGMAMDMIKMAGKVDTIVVASGNGVFVDAARLIKSNGTKFECCTFRRSVSKELLQVADAYHFLNQEHLRQ